MPPEKAVVARSRLHYQLRFSEELEYQQERRAQADRAKDQSDLWPIWPRAV